MIALPAPNKPPARKAGHPRAADHSSNHITVQAKRSQPAEHALPARNRQRLFCLASVWNADGKE